MGKHTLWLAIAITLAACGDDGPGQIGELEDAAVVDARTSVDASERDASAPLDARMAAPPPPPDAAAASDGSMPGQRDAGSVSQGPHGPSAGCSKKAPGSDSTSAWVEHDLMVDGITARFATGGKSYGSQHGYDFTHRNYFIRLPVKYDPARAYSLVISAGGCGATDGVSGKGGGSNPLANDQADAVQIGLSYVYPNGAGACFADGFADTPDLPYFDAVLAEADAAYCFDRGKVFVSGFSSGAWETYMLAHARAGVIRGIGTQAGGLRKDRPAASKQPVAAFLTAGTHDDNPISNVDKDGFDSGSQAARDVILAVNGCTSKETVPFVTELARADWNCLRYTSCPAAYPVIWCAISADGGKHGAGSNKAFWPFWSALP